MSIRKPVANSLEAVATLVGTSIGAGVLGLPYAVSHAGFGIGMVMLLALGWLNIILQMMFAEVTLRTKEQHQIPGYAGIYLGPYVKKIGFVVGVTSAYGTLLAYIIASGQILQALLGGTSTAWSLVYFAGISFLVYKGLDTIKILEVIMSAFVASIMVLIWVVAFPHVDPSNLLYMHIDQTAQVYGVLLFALSATVAIPEVRQELVGQERMFPKIIIFANLFTIAVYALFTLFVLGVTGSATTEVATIGLGNFIGPWMLVIGNILAFFTITTSCLTIGLAVRRVFQFDYGFPRWKALAATVVIPLIIFFSGFRNFIQVLGIVGGIGLGLQSSIVVFSYWRSRIHGERKPEFTLGVMSLPGLIMLAVFAIGAILTITAL
jgi:tyrosine-specific transport protein